ncbi:MAG TPA: arsenate reductase (glutaredoxin) [Arenimonas sp.]|uniref:arsenate reductase (glutaredoxin) n=1 Tax=Arenimonas sp. TaxID=1872635 RepID=UPI002CF4FBBC|nr:arsenate reductase (glutaredoxin) [Arenimonas sp.]HMB57307.1 arsenate reductase (glutaredoxin) [Arenimonas sp.]
MNESVLLHNPGCSKSREALALLQARGIEPRILAYLESPPDAAQIDALLAMLALEPRELMRRDESDYSALGLDNPALTRTALIAAMVAHPALIQRPVFIHRGRAVIGRPPERVFELL